jgi:transposase
MPPQLTESDRAVLAELLKLKVSKREIARRLGKHHSTIYRELARNTGPVGYVYQEAQQRTEVRRRLGRRNRKMDDPQVRKYVCRRLKQYWSPDQIAGRLELERRHPVSHKFPGRRSTRGSASVRPRSGSCGAAACGSEYRDEDAVKIQVACRTPSASMAARPSWLPVGATAIGKETRSSGRKRCQERMALELS